MSWMGFLDRPRALVDLIVIPYFVQYTYLQCYTLKNFCKELQPFSFSFSLHLVKHKPDPRLVPRGPIARPAVQLLYQPHAFFTESRTAGRLLKPGTRPWHPPTSGLNEHLLNLHIFFSLLSPLFCLLLCGLGRAAIHIQRSLERFSLLFVAA